GTRAGRPGAGPSLLMPPAVDKPGNIMLASMIALIVIFLLAGFWLRYHKTAPTPSIKGTPVSSQ
ncbi:MAG TPA: hypothetical protein VL155_03510, partial [Terriglobales bacterium]|nr:hypothetical protein [Terriglobales bacterium]